MLGPVDYQWSFLFAPGLSPPFTGQGTASASFVPPGVGSYIVGLTLSNSCGATSPGAGGATVVVQ